MSFFSSVVSGALAVLATPLVLASVVSQKKEERRALVVAAMVEVNIIRVNAGLEPISDTMATFSVFGMLRSVCTYMHERVLAFEALFAEGFVSGVKNCFLKLWDGVCWCFSKLRGVFTSDGFASFLDLLLLVS